MAKELLHLQEWQFRASRNIVTRRFIAAPRICWRMNRKVGTMISGCAFNAVHLKKVVPTKAISRTSLS